MGFNLWTNVLNPLHGVTDMGRMSCAMKRARCWSSSFFIEPRGLCLSLTNPKSVILGCFASVSWSLMLGGAGGWMLMTLCPAVSFCITCKQLFPSLYPENGAKWMTSSRSLLRCWYPHFLRLVLPFHHHLLLSNTYQMKVRSLTWMAVDLPCWTWMAVDLPCWTWMATNLLC